MSTTYMGTSNANFNRNSVPALPELPEDPAALNSPVRRKTKPSSSPLKRNVPLAARRDLLPREDERGRGNAGSKTWASVGESAARVAAKTTVSVVTSATVARIPVVGVPLAAAARVVANDVINETVGSNRGPKVGAQLLHEWRLISLSSVRSICVFK